MRWNDRCRRPTETGQARYPQQSDNPLLSIREIPHADCVPYPAKRKSCDVALLCLELSVHPYLHTETM